MSAVSTFNPQQLRALLEKHHLTYHRAAAFTTLSQGELWKLAHGRIHAPSWVTLMKLTYAFHVPTASFFAKSVD